MPLLPGEVYQEESHRELTTAPAALSPQHPRSAANPARGADTGSAQQPLERRAAGQPFVARVQRPGDALAPRGSASAGPAHAVETAGARATADAVSTPRAGHRAGNGVRATQAAKALAGRHAGPGSAGQVHVIGTADQSRFARARKTRLATAAICRAGQELGIDSSAAMVNDEPAEDRCRNDAPDAAQHGPPRVPAGEPFGQVVKPPLVHGSSSLAKATDASKLPRPLRGPSRSGQPGLFRARREGSNRHRTRRGRHSTNRHAHRPRLPQYPEQHSGQVSPQLQESEQYPPVPAHGALQSLGFEQTPAPPGVPGDDAQHTSPLLHGCKVPVAHPHPMYVQLNPARLRAGTPAASSAPAATASRRTVPRRDCRVARDRVIASNRCPSMATPPLVPSVNVPCKSRHGSAEPWNAQDLAARTARQRARSGRVDHVVAAGCGRLTPPSHHASPPARSRIPGMGDPSSGTNASSMPSAPTTRVTGSPIRLPR